MLVVAFTAFVAIPHNAIPAANIEQTVLQPVGAFSGWFRALPEAHLNDGSSGKTALSQKIRFALIGLIQPKSGRAPMTII
jgi:hypothetical protein